MDIAGFDALVTALPCVRRRDDAGVLRWHTRGRLIARQVDATSVALRVPFDVRHHLVRQSPAVFSVPNRFTKHMMVMADLSADGAETVIEQALLSGWRLQTAASAAGG